MKGYEDHILIDADHPAVVVGLCARVHRARLCVTLCLCCEQRLRPRRWPPLPMRMVMRRVRKERRTPCRWTSHQPIRPQWTAQIQGARARCARASKAKLTCVGSGLESVDMMSPGAAVAPPAMPKTEEVGSSTDSSDFFK